MLKITDKGFKYTNAASTDISKRFKRVKAQIAALKKESEARQAQADAELDIKLVPIARRAKS